MEIMDLVYVIAAILIAFIVLKLFFWLLPVIVFLLIAFFVYVYLTGRNRY